MRLTERLRADWKALSLIGTIFAAGVGVTVKASAAFYSTKKGLTLEQHVQQLDEHVQQLDEGQAVLQSNYGHLHEDVLGVRQDLRDNRAGRELPVLPVEGTPTPLPTAVVETSPLPPKVIP